MRQSETGLRCSTLGRTRRVERAERSGVPRMGKRPDVTPMPTVPAKPPQRRQRHHNQAHEANDRYRQEHRPLRATPPVVATPEHLRPTATLSTSEVGQREKQGAGASMRSGSPVCHDSPARTLADQPQPQEEVQPQEPLQVTVAAVDGPLHWVLHRPAPHCTAPPWHADVPVHWVSHDAWAGQWRCMSWQADVCPQFTAHGELSSQLMWATWHDDTPVHWT